MVNTIGIWIAATLTLFIFSFLYKDNPFYKFAEHLYVGVSAAYWLIYVWSFTLHPLVFKPIFTGSRGIILALIPFILGLMMLTRLVPKISWISRWPMAFTVGLGAGLGIIGALQGTLFPQLKATIIPLWVPGSIYDTVNNLIIIIGVLTTIFYFFFSIEHEGIPGKIARTGIIFIMISFGASFGYTVMARVSLLIGRIGFLLSDWLKII